jgi:hypothetical protein
MKNFLLGIIAACLMLIVGKMYEINTAYADTNSIMKITICEYNNPNNCWKP